MIRYALRCERGHAFESWFQDSSSFEKQAKRGLVSCPTCDSVKVEKSIMAPQIPRKGRTAEQRAREGSASRSAQEKGRGGLGRGDACCAVRTRALGDGAGYGIPRKAEGTA